MQPTAPQPPVPPDPPAEQERPEPADSDEPDSPGPDPSPASPRRDALAIDLTLQTPDTDPPLTGWLDEQLRQAAARLGITAGQLSLAIVHDAEMAELHEQYTGVAGTTDVLTFDLADDPPTGSDDPDTPVTRVEADIVLCRDEAQRQAEQRRHPVRHELLLYAVHGLLHMIGEDDHTEAGYQRMHAREDELLQALGIGRVFTPDPQA